MTVTDRAAATEQEFRARIAAFETAPYPLEVADARLAAVAAYRATGGAEEARWVAVAVDADGFVLSDEDLRGWAAAIAADKTGWSVPCEPPTRVAIVKGSAVPKPQSDDPDEKFFRLPSSYYTDDMFLEVDDLDEEEPETVLLAWMRSQAAAAGLNAAGAR